MKMKYFYQLLASVGLALVLIPSILHFMDRLTLDEMKTFILLGTMLWFAGAIPWLGKKRKT